MPLPQVFPRFYGEVPLRWAAHLTWEETRPADEEYWLRVAELQTLGGWWADVQLVELHSAPDQPPLLALRVAPVQGRYFPQLLREDALLGTDFEGVPPRVSLCFKGECGRGALLEAMRRWGHRRRVWLAVAWIGGGASAQLGECEVTACPALAWLHAHGWYASRGLHVSL